MKVLIVDREGYMLNFALRCREAGHEVRWGVGPLKTGDRNEIGDGFGLDKRRDWQGSMRWADLIVLPDNASYMAELEVFQRRGYPIFGPNCEVTEWETIRQRGQDVLDAVGVKLIPCHKFRRPAEAMAFLRSNPNRYVSKPDHDGGNKSLSYVGKSAKDLMYMLSYWEKNSSIKSDFVLQEFCPGIEVAVGGWFGRGGFSSWFLENFEHKKLMNGDIGVNTGEMGTVMQYRQDSRLAEYLLRPLEGMLYRARYTGYIDVSVIVGEDGVPYPLEFTTRPGWPLFQIQQSLHPDPCGWMFDLLEGRDTFSPSEKVAVGVILAIPDFPYSRLTKKVTSGYPLYGWDKIPPNNLHIDEVKMGEAPGDDLEVEPIPVTAGDKVCTISGNARTVKGAQKAAYKHVKLLELPNSPMYRTDIGDRLKKQIPKLQSYGWCEGWDYGEV